MKHKLLGMIRANRAFVLFMVVGAANTLITWAVVYLLSQTPFFAAHSMFASGIGYAAGVLHGYYWSTRAVFKKKRTGRNFLQFLAVNVLVLGLNLALFALFADRWGLSALLSQICVTPFTMIGNYLLNRYWTFR